MDTQGASLICISFPDSDHGDEGLSGYRTVCSVYSLYSRLKSETFSYVYINDDAVNDWKLRSNAQNYINFITEGVASKADATHKIAAALPTAPFFSKALAHVVDYYIAKERQKEREEIVKLAKENKTANVMTYVEQALRKSLNTTSPLI